MKVLAFAPATESSIEESKVGRFALLSTIVVLILLVAFAVIAIIDPDTTILATLSQEDGVIESLAALFWAMACGVCAYRLVRRQRQSRPLLALWMVLTFVFLGEEVSWFQRILGVATPPAVVDINSQGEFNLHNLNVLNSGMLNMENVFRLGFISYFLLLPLLMASNRVRGWATRVGYSRPHRSFLVMVWTVIVGSVIFAQVAPQVAREAIVETQETFFAFVVLSYIVVYLREAPPA